MANEMLVRLIARQEEARTARAELVDKRAAVVQVATDEARDNLTEAEDVEFNEFTDQIRTLDEDILKRQERIDDLASEDKRTDQAAAAFRKADIASARVKVGAESRMYEKGNGRSYLADLALTQIKGDPEARARLERHAQEVQTDPEYRDLNRTDSTGGYFVPPLWLMNDYVALARAGRPTANIINSQPLPPGTDSINVPMISTGTAVAIQTADNAAVQETDLADTTISAGVKTIAGQQDVSIQALEQSPVNFDQIIFADLLADYATKLDVQVLAGSNGSGQVKGLLGATGINAITYTDSTPTVGELYAKIADAVQQIHTGRFMPPTVIVMHPRRWGWFLAALDSSNRPLVVPNAQGPNNAVGTFGGVVSEQVVGSIMGLPVITDPSVPVGLGASTNEDRIIVMRASDLWLWESSVKTRVLPDVGSGTLTVRLQVYGYLAFTAERYPKSISVIAGTGLTTPTF